MSKSEFSTSYGAPTPPGPYPYIPRTNESNGTRTATILPPMSSLLPKIERIETHNSYPAHPHPTQQQDMNHPLWLSERDPNAPVQHIYRPPQPSTDSQSAQYSADPILVPRTQNSAYPIRHLPPTQPRQVKRIVQRRPGADVPKGYTNSEMPPMPGQDTYDSSQPPTQASTTFQHGQGSMSSPTTSKGPSSRLPIANLLTDTPASDNSSPRALAPLTPNSPEPDGPPPVKYKLTMRQQPQAARACGFGERDRRVVDPPPILEMKVDGEHYTSEEISALIRQPNAVVHCTLWDPVADKDDTAMPGTTDKRQQRRLMGTLVSSPFVGKDEHNVEGCFFTFPDLSVRTPGTYSLRFSLMILDPARMFSGQKVGISSLVFSQPFHVYNAKDFGGMLASTELTKRLKHQGCLISVKKGNAKAGGGKHAGDDDDDLEEEDEDDEDGEGGSGKGKKPAKKQKR